jgi:hypothetical protein
MNQALYAHMNNKRKKNLYNARDQKKKKENEKKSNILRDSI